LSCDNSQHNLTPFSWAGKEHSGQFWDWTGIAASLPAPYPQRNSYHKLQARQQGYVLPPDREQFLEAMIKRGQMRDEQAFAEALQTYSSEKAEGEKLAERRERAASRLSVSDVRETDADGREN
jgi:hypothetical protein